MVIHDRLKAELHSRWFGKSVFIKEDGRSGIMWRVVNAYYTVNDNSVQVATLEIIPWTENDSFSANKLVVEVNEVERI